MDSNLKTIQEYELRDDYANALGVAKHIYEESLKNGSTQELANLSQTIARLEKSFLNLGYSRLLFDENAKPKAALSQLLEILGQSSENNSKNSLEDINDWSQKNILRQGERWQEQRLRFEELKPKIKPLLQDLGFINSISPHFNAYEGAIIHGAFLPRIRLRLYYLVLQWNQGVRFSDLYFLSGQRPLDALLENREALVDEMGSLLKVKKDWKEPTNLPKTEIEMVQLIWEQSEIPDDMRKQVKVHYISAPMKTGPSGEKTIRPTTDDTIDEWLKTAPPHGCYLAITNAPYINRQDLVGRTLAPKEYTFDTIGPKADEEGHISIFLDELARLIFQTKRLVDKEKAI